MAPTTVPPPQGASGTHRMTAVNPSKTNVEKKQSIYFAAGARRATPARRVRAPAPTALTARTRAGPPAATTSVSTGPTSLSGGTLQDTPNQ